MQANRRINICSTQSLSAGVNGGTINPIIATYDTADAGVYKLNTQSANPLLVVIINTLVAPTGVGASVVYHIQVSVDGLAGTWADLPNISSSIVGAGVVRIINDYVLEPFFQVTAVISGTSTPTFPSVSIDAFMTSPDS